MLTIQDLTIEYPGEPPVLAVDALDLSVKRGEVVAIVGPSGCGKSTLLRAVAGLQVPSAGTVSWDGADLRNVAVHERGFGLMFQTHALFAHRNVSENIAFGLKMAGWTAEQQRHRVGELLDLVNLAGYERRAVASLSGGEAQRVALIRALAPQPELLLLDEPLGALDRQLRADLVDELRRLLRELRQTTLHVTHDLTEALDIADRIAVMHQGRMLRVGTPSELWDDPQSRFVAEFLGHSVVHHGGTQLAVRPGDARIVSMPDAPEASGADRVLVEATVTDVRFRRPVALMTCRDAMGRDWTVDQNSEIGGRSAITIGQDVVIAYRPSRLPQLVRD